MALRTNISRYLLPAKIFSNGQSLHVKDSRVAFSKRKSEPTRNKDTLSIQRRIINRIETTGAMSVETSSIGHSLPGKTHESCVYLDYNATTPIFPEVAAEMAPFLFEHFGNPSSTHAFGRPCARAVALARTRVAALLSCKPDEIIFTSCGTESDNLAIIGVVEASAARLPAAAVPHVVSTTVEHPAVLECLNAMQTQGRLTYTLVDVDSTGRVEAKAVAAAMTPLTVLVTVMHSNNEVGAILPVREIAELVRGRGALVHTDAAQSVGKVPVKADDLGVDLITVVGHKFGAPKGVAALYVRSGTCLGRVQYGGGQEGGRRAGTESVLLLAGLGKAAELAETELSEVSANMQRTRDLLQKELLAGCASLGVDTLVHGPAPHALRLPNTLSLGLKKVNASLLLAEVAEGLAASAGSACHSDRGTSISPVLKAMNVPVEFAMGTLRLSTGRHTSNSQIESAVNLILNAIKKQLEE
mmetsp:Transcript_16428/g.22702  ORF Transcript_16428/g.22702 Transcript_16428/m.22702 type:complete len:471 (+) Transcript_16428:49-1461(+)